MAQNLSSLDTVLRAVAGTLTQFDFKLGWVPHLLMPQSSEKNLCLSCACARKLILRISMFVALWPALNLSACSRLESLSLCLPVKGAAGHADYLRVILELLPPSTRHIRIGLSSVHNSTLSEHMFFWSMAETLPWARYVPPLLALPNLQSFDVARDEFDGESDSHPAFPGWLVSTIAQELRPVTERGMLVI